MKQNTYPMADMHAKMLLSLSAHPFKELDLR